MKKSPSLKPLNKLSSKHSAYTFVCRSEWRKWYNVLNMCWYIPLSFKNTFFHSKYVTTLFTCYCFWQSLFWGFLTAFWFQLGLFFICAMKTYMLRNVDNCTLFYFVIILLFLFTRMITYKFCLVYSYTEWSSAIKSTEI